MFALLLLGASRKNPLCRELTVAQMENTIKQWLRSASDREGGRERRRKVKDQKQTEEDLLLLSL